MTNQRFPVGKAAYAALLCLFSISVVALNGCGNKGDDAANLDKINTKPSAVVPSNAPPAAQAAIQASQAQGEAMRQRGAAQSDALKAAAQGGK